MKHPIQLELSSQNLQNLEAVLEMMLMREVTARRSAFLAAREELSAAGKREELLSKYSGAGAVRGPREYEY